MTGERTAANAPATMASAAWIVPANAGLGVLVIGALLVPLEDPVRRVTVGVLLALMVVVIVASLWRGWRRMPQSRLVRCGVMTVWFWAWMASTNFLFLDGTAAQSVVGGLVGAAIFGLLMWFVVPGPEGVGREV